MNNKQLTKLSLFILDKLCLEENRYQVKNRID